MFSINFNRNVIPEALKIQFQGGFVGQDCSIFIVNNNQTHNKLLLEEGVNWDDDNDVQEWIFSKNDENEGGCCKGIQLKFGGSTDFYGRIIIYNVEIWGREESA